MKARCGYELLLGGYDTVATDIAAAMIMGYDKDEILWQTVTGAGPALMGQYWCWKAIGGMLDPRGIQVLGVDKLPNAEFVRMPFSQYTESYYNIGKAYPPAIQADYQA